MLFGLFKKRKAANSLNGSGYRFMMGGSTSGKHVNERSAMQIRGVCLRENSVGVNCEYAGSPLLFRT